MAITKERLEELIKEGATIYRAYADVNVYEVKLSKTLYETDNAHLWKKLNNGFSVKRCGYPLDCLFETEEEAEWYVEFGSITRTETLSLPTWEEFNNKYKSKYSPVIGFNGKNTQCFYEMFFKKDDSKEGCVLIYDCDCKEYVYSNRLTQENYLEACRVCKKLFLGEEV